MRSCVWRAAALFWCCVSVGWAFPIPHLPFTPESLPVSLSGMKTAEVQCVSAERFRTIVVTIAIRETLQRDTISRVMVYAYNGARFRVQQVNVSTEPHRKVAHLREWVHDGESRWVEIDPLMDDETKVEFWTGYASVRFDTTPHDLMNFSSCRE